MHRAVLLLPPFFVAACTTANIGPQAAENQTLSIIVSAGYDEAFRAAAQSAASMKWEIINSDKDTGVIGTTYDGTLTRWSDEVSIMLREVDGGTQITVRSKLGQKPNRDYVRQYLDAVAEAI